MDQIDGTGLHHAEIEGPVATITLTRPEVLNALNHEQRVSLAATVTRLNADDAVRVIVLRGEGRAFCAGQDQRESAGMDQHKAAQRIEDYSRLYRAVRETDKPVISRLHGYAAGAGLQLALLSDLRIAARSLKLGMTELERGSACIMGSGLLWSIAGEASMKRLVLLADFITADEALSRHIVDEVVEDDRLDARVQEITARLAAFPPTAIRLTKAWWRQMSDPQFDRINEQARVAHARNFATGSFTHAAAAFVARSGHR